MAHNLGTSLRQTVAQIPTVKVIKTPAGVKRFLARGDFLQFVEEDEESETVVANTEQMTLDGDAREMPVDVHAMWTTPQKLGRASSSPSPPLSAVSCPTRGWESPGGSVMSAPTARFPEGPQGLPPRTSPLKQAIYYLCYGGGHFFLDCPRLPAEVRREAAANREAYLQQSPQAVPSQMACTRPATPHTSPCRSGSVQGHTPLPGVGTVPGVGPVVHVFVEEFPDEEGLNEDGLTNTGAENAVGGN
jgi:hypothetical protein